jgi:hypothetical protein
MFGNKIRPAQVAPGGAVSEYTLSVKFGYWFWYIAFEAH